MQLRQDQDLNLDTLQGHSAKVSFTPILAPRNIHASSQGQSSVLSETPRVVFQTLPGISSCYGHY